MDNNIILAVIGLVVLLLVGTIIHLVLKLRASQKSIRYSEEHSEELGDELFGNNDLSTTNSLSKPSNLGSAASSMQGNAQSSAQNHTHSNAQSNKVISQVAEFLAEGHDTKAIALLNTAITQHPENSKFHTMLLNIYAKNNDAENFEKTVDSLHALGDIEAIAKANKLREQLKPSANELPMEDLLAKSQPAAMAASTASAASNLLQDAPAAGQSATATSMSAIDAALNDDISISQQLNAIEHTLVSNKPLTAEAPAQAAAPASSSGGDIDDMLFSFDEEVETYKPDNTLTLSTNELNIPASAPAAPSTVAAAKPSSDDDFFNLELEDSGLADSKPETSLQASAQPATPADISSNEIDFSFDDFSDKAASNDSAAGNEPLAFDMPAAATPAAVETAPAAVPTADLEPVSNDIEFDFAASMEDTSTTTDSSAATDANNDNAGFEFEFESSASTDTKLDTNIASTELSLDTELSPAPEVADNKNVTLEMLAAEAGVSINPAADAQAASTAPADIPATEAASTNNDTFAEFDALFAENKKSSPPVAPASEGGSGIFTGVAATAAVGAAALAAKASDTKADLSIPDIPATSSDISLDISQVDIETVSPEQVVAAPATTELSFESPAFESSELESPAFSADEANDVADVTFAAEFDQINPADINTGSFDTLDLPDQNTVTQNLASLTESSTTSTEQPDDGMSFDFTDSSTPTKADDFEFSLGDAVTSANITTVSAAALAESSSSDNNAFLSKLQSELGFIEELDANETNLELASSYIKLGEFSSAKSLLQEVMQTGSEAQKNQANKLITKLAA